MSIGPAKTDGIIEAICTLQTEIRIATLAKIWSTFPADMDPDHAVQLAGRVYRCLREES